MTTKLAGVVAAAAFGIIVPQVASAQDQPPRPQSSVVAAEIATIAKQLGLRPETAIDFSDVSGEYCFNAGLGQGGHMTHYAIEPEERTEDVIDFVNAQPLLDAGVPVDKLPVFPGGLESMTPNQWYYLPAGEFDPHHGRAFPFPMMVRASSLD